MTPAFPDCPTGSCAVLPEPEALVENERIVVGLDAVIVAVTDEEPRVLVLRKPGGDGPGGWQPALPSGPLQANRHRTLEIGLRTWVEAQTRLHLGYVEQLYTFGDRARSGPLGNGSPGAGAPVRRISVGYLALVEEPGLDPEPASDLADPSDADPSNGATYGDWSGWYGFLPWEDWRNGRPAVLDAEILPRLEHWAKSATNDQWCRRRRERVTLAFGQDGSWNDERVLERYELLYETGLVGEFRRDHPEDVTLGSHPGFGRTMAWDHRRVLATALGRLRGKIKYRPVVFELMPAHFTLLQLQRVVEALAGQRLHKQNFRRLLHSTGLVEGTGRFATGTGGRPAEQFRFRPEVVLERMAPGVRLPNRHRNG